MPNLTRNNLCPCSIYRREVWFPWSAQPNVKIFSLIMVIGQKQRQKYSWEILFENYCIMWTHHLSMLTSYDIESTRNLRVRSTIIQHICGNQNRRLWMPGLCVAFPNISVKLVASSPYKSICFWYANPSTNVTKFRLWSNLQSIVIKKTFISLEM